MYWYFDGERFGEEQIREFKYWTDIFIRDRGTRAKLIIIVNKKDAQMYIVPIVYLN